MDENQQTMLPIALHPLDRREGESPEAYQAFLIYAALPATDRSTAGVLRRYRPDSNGTSTTWLKEWSAKFDWVSRAAENDQIIAKAALDFQVKARAKEIEEYRAHHVQFHEAVGTLSTLLMAETAKTIDEGVKQNRLHEPEIGEKMRVLKLASDVCFNLQRGSSIQRESWLQLLGLEEIIGKLQESAALVESN